METKPQDSQLEPSLSYVGLAIGSMLLSAGVRAASKRFGLTRYMGWVGPAILLYSFYRQFYKNENSLSANNLLH